MKHISKLIWVILGIQFFYVQPSYAGSVFVHDRFITDREHEATQGSVREKWGLNHYQLVDENVFLTIHFPDERVPHDKEWDNLEQFSRTHASLAVEPLRHREIRIKVKKFEFKKAAGEKLVSTYYVTERAWSGEKKRLVEGELNYAVDAMAYKFKTDFKSDTWEIPYRVVTIADEMDINGTYNELFCEYAFEVEYEEDGKPFVKEYANRVRLVRDSRRVTKVGQNLIKTLLWPVKKYAESLP